MPNSSRVGSGRYKPALRKLHASDSRSPYWKRVAAWRWIWISESRATRICRQILTLTSTTPSGTTMWSLHPSNNSHLPKWPSTVVHSTPSLAEPLWESKYRASWCAQCSSACMKLPIFRCVMYFNWSTIYFTARIIIIMLHRPRLDSYLMSYITAVSLNFYDYVCIHAPL